MIPNTNNQMLNSYLHHVYGDESAKYKLHELMIHTMHYAQHEARMMVLGDIGVLVKKAGNK